MTSGRKGPRDVICGTTSGYTTHYRLGEKPCPECYEAAKAAETVRRHLKAAARLEATAAERAAKVIARAEAQAARRARQEAWRRGETCRRGHPWTPESTGTQSKSAEALLGTSRKCLICVREWKENYLLTEAAERRREQNRIKGRTRVRSPEELERLRLARQTATEADRARARIGKRLWAAAHRDEIAAKARAQYAADPLKYRAYARECSERRHRLEAS